jgi:pyruvate dehydrogenase E1 component alpha subunit
MHMGDLSKRIVAIISAMAASVPVATGAAMALKYQGSRNIVFNYFGDGATSRGDWHEGINLAAVQKAPVVFICNNNQYAYSTPLDKQMACANVAIARRAMGFPRRSSTAMTFGRLRCHAPRRRALPRGLGTVSARVQDVSA